MSAPPRARSSGRSGAYVATIVVDIVLIYVVSNLLEWNWLPFLTSDFSKVVTLIVVSLGVAIFLNVVYLLYHRYWFKALGQTVLGLINIAVTLRLYRVFPFDFSPYPFDWATVLRVLLIMALVGAGIGIVVELARLVRRTIPT
jgi:uncharacterized protein (DUF486 family)